MQKELFLISEFLGYATNYEYFADDSPSGFSYERTDCGK